ncbi:MAG: undecaprenyldiphospho-muramoylpentapeptide beta-N-acetylglucosaminyltransferase [Clostridia bacterium]|nr:undecaprenyldiphospho-muramoylpentapeptide beta-N-acetylglucosaminyltransferase [Clostridia bacterium]
MRIILCGGGSAGHINPALAIAEEVKLREPKSEILFICREGGFENGMVKKAGIPIKHIKISGIQRRLTLKNIKNILGAMEAIKRAKEIIGGFSPDAVVGTGGYVSWPVIRAAQMMKIPTVIHESNCSPGLTTKLLAKKCTRVLINHKETANLLNRKNNIQVVGNPMRKDFTRLSRIEARQKLNIRKDEIYILSFGGSLGAERLNDTVISFMKEESESNKKLRHLHATGKRYYEKNEGTKFANGKKKIVPYIENMPLHLSAADIVICRSGAVTLSEIALVGVTAILIPSPNVTDNHQYKNAKVIADSDACVLIEEKDLTKEVLREKIYVLINDKNRRDDIAKRVKKFAFPNSSELAVDNIISAIQK